MATAVKRWDQEADVVVVGSGGAALPAAILAHDNGAKVLVIERSDKVGGTTALSGGAAWIPLNHHMEKAGIKDSREAALTYCKLLTAGRAPDEMVETFVDTAPQMLRYMEEHCHVKFNVIADLPDYQPEKEGGCKGGRTLDAELFDSKGLGEWASKLRKGPAAMFPVTIAEAMGSKYKMAVHVKNAPVELIMERMGQGLLATGPSLAGQLLKACLDRGVTILLETRGRELIMEDGRIVGLRAEREGKDLFVKAPAVVLACGGFEWNKELLNKFLPGPIGGTCSPPHCNEGDGLIMAMEVGADLANMTEGWLSPGAVIPGQESEGEPVWSLVFTDRSVPHTITVNRYGERFVNESANYNDMGKAFWYFDPVAYDYRNIPSWLIIDSQYRQKYPIMSSIMPDYPDPEWLTKDDTLAGLARKVGIDPQGLEATVARWNGFVREGKDRDFHRGESAYDRAWFADPEAPHPNLGTIEKPPFYTFPIELGFMGGTNGGPRTNTKGQVLNVRGRVIPGLYAAGNTAASPCGPAYWGGGATISTAMTFGYICGINAAKEAKRGA